MLFNPLWKVIKLQWSYAERGIRHKSHGLVNVFLKTVLLRNCISVTLFVFFVVVVFLSFFFFLMRAAQATPWEDPCLVQLKCNNDNSNNKRAGGIACTKRPTAFVTKTNKKKEEKKDKARGCYVSRLSHKKGRLRARLTVQGFIV